MSQEISFSKSSKPFPGWIGVATIALFYAGLYAVNFWFPLNKSDLTSRIWNWSQNALTIAALVLLIRNKQYLKLTTVLLGLALATLSALSHWLHDPSLSWSLQEGMAVGVCFLSAVVLFYDTKAIQ